MSKVSDAIARFWDDNKTKIIFGLGGLLTVGGTVYACKQTLNVPEIMKEHRERLKKTQMAVETGIDATPGQPESVRLSEKDKKVAMVKCYSKTVFDLGKNYILPVGIEAAGLGMMTYAHATVEDQKAGLAIAVANTTAMFENYRRYIREHEGEEVDTAARYSLEKEVKKGKKSEEDTVTYKAPEKLYSDYSVFLDRNDPNSGYDKDDGYLLNSLQSTQQWVNKKLLDDWDHKISMAEVYNLARSKPMSEQIIKSSRVMGHRYEKKYDKLDENGYPDKFKIYVMTVWPKVEMVPVSELIAERANYIAMKKEWNRLDKDSVLIDFTAPEVIV